MNPEAWIVLGVGVATVLSQVWAASVTSDAAKLQLQASRVALQNQLLAVLVFSQGGYSNEAGTLHVHNGGRYAAIDLRVECVSETATIIGGRESDE